MEKHSIIFLSEELTQNFYRWEKRGRGWQVYDYPVEIEPPYEPFFHYISQKPALDDGRKETIFSKLKEKLKSLLIEEKKKTETFVFEENLSEPLPEPFIKDFKLSFFEITLPSQEIPDFSKVEQFLLSLKYLSAPISFEIIGTFDGIFIQFSCHEKDYFNFLEQLKTFFPEIVIDQTPDLLEKYWKKDEKIKKIVVDFGLSYEFMLPLRTFKDFKIDPLVGIIGALSELKENEIGIFQILFQGTKNPWQESILRAILDFEGKPFFVDAPQIVTLAKQKLNRPFFATIIRIGVASPKKERTWQIAKALSSALNQFSNPFSNELIPLDNEGYPEKDHENDLILRQSHRTGMILNSEELTSLVHFPLVSIEKLKRETKKTKAAPKIVFGNTLILGENIHQGKRNIVSLNPDQRIKHTYIIGATGTGKSTLLLNMIIQDIKNNEGIAVLDPHGDLIDKILGYIPERRFSDVILFDPSDKDYPIGFNIFYAHSELEKDILASDLVGIFKRLSKNWGEQMTCLLRNAVLAILESERGGTLYDLKRFLVEKEFRESFLKTVKDKEVIYYWQKEFPLLSSNPQAPILTRLDIFLKSKILRNIVCQKENKLDFFKIMNEGKIFLAKLSQGIIGQENSYLLGSLIVSAIHKAALSRQTIEEKQRKNFYLYLDEFQDFITPSMALILSGARKYHLGLVLAHQELQQLIDKDKNVASSVLSNPYIRICFRVGETDAKRLAQGLSFFDEKDLQNLSVGEAICRIEKAEFDFNLKTILPEEIDPEIAQRRKKEIIKLSREKYASKRSEIESFVESLIKEKEILKPEEKIKPKPVITPQVIEEVEKEVLKEIPKPAYEKLKEITTEIKTETDKFLGKGGPKHKYLQQLIKKFAQEKGYKAEIEKVLPTGEKVDISLKKDKTKIACQICLTTPESYEIENIKKCLKAGYEKIIMISTQKRILKNLKDLALKEVEKESQKKLMFFTPEEFFSFFEKEAVVKEDIVAGYKVKIRYQPLSEEEQKEKSEAISKVILKSLKKLKGN